MATRKLQTDYIQPSGKIKTLGIAASTPSASRRSGNAFRATAIAILGVGLLGGCAGPRLEPMAGAPTAETTLAEAGIRLTISPNAWSGFPADLSRYFTPLALRIENQRSEEAQVRYEDFVALDDDRVQYRAVSPAEAARAMSGSSRFRPNPGEALPSLLAGGAWP